MLILRVGASFGADREGRTMRQACTFLRDDRPFEVFSGNGVRKQGGPKLNLNFSTI
jgi:hypothetical protein